MKRILIVGAGAIGSLYAAHLARVAEVWVLVRREEHGRSINDRGIRVTGHNEFHAHLRACTDARELPHFDFGVVATKANQTREAFAPVAHLFPNGAVLSAQNGLGSEEVIAELMPSGYVIRGTTFHERHAFCRRSCALRTEHCHLDGTVRANEHALRAGGRIRCVDQCLGT